MKPVANKCRHCQKPVFEHPEERGPAWSAQHNGPWATSNGDYGCDASPETGPEGVGPHRTGCQGCGSVPTGAHGYCEPCHTLIHSVPADQDDDDQDDDRRPSYVDQARGVRVVGPTSLERREVSEALAEDEKSEADRLRDPTQALVFLRECNGEPAKHARDLALGKRIKLVEEVVAVRSSAGFTRSATEVVARVRTADRKWRLVRATVGSHSGSIYEPPDSDVDVRRITEEEAARLRTAWGGRQ